MIIGQKGLDALPVLCKAELDEFINGFEQTLKQGIPLEVPAAMAIGHLARMAVTLKRYREVAESLVKVQENEDLTEVDKALALAGVLSSAKEVLAAPPPAPVKSSILSL